MIKRTEIRPAIGARINAKIGAKITALLVAAMCLVSMTSCSSISVSPTDLLAAPKPTGEMNEIQQALYDYAGKDITLKYPNSGENRTAFVRSDLDNDGVNEAIAFYSTDNADGVNEIHINVIDNKDDGWVSTNDVATGASGVDKVSVGPVSKSGEQVLMVGVELFSTTGNQLNIFTLNKGKLILRMQESYSNYLQYDLMSAGYAQLVLVNQNATDRQADVKIYSVDSSSTQLLGLAGIDGNVSSISAVTAGNLSSGRPAVFIDSVKSTSSMITDVVYFDGDSFVDPFFDQTLLETQKTLRDSTSVCTDIDGDGITEIPFTTVMPGYKSKSANERLYITTWCSFDGAKLSKVMSGDFNYTDGYYLSFPEKWHNSITVMVDEDGNTRSYCSWNKSLNIQETEILRIRTLSADDFSDADLGDGQVELGSNGSVVWVGEIILDSGDYAVDANELRKMFGTL